MSKRGKQATNHPFSALPDDEAIPMVGALPTRILDPVTARNAIVEPDPRREPLNLVRVKLA